MFHLRSFQVNGSTSMDYELKLNWVKKRKALFNNVRLVCLNCKSRQNLTLNLFSATFQAQSIQPCRAKPAVLTYSAPDPGRSPAVDAVCRRGLKTAVK